jgi:hypothetical protein
MPATRRPSQAHRERVQRIVDALTCVVAIAAATIVRPMPNGMPNKRQLAIDLQVHARRGHQPERMNHAPSRNMPSTKNIAKNTCCPAVGKFREAERHVLGVRALRGDALLFDHLGRVLLARLRGFGLVLAHLRLLGRRMRFLQRDAVAFGLRGPAA